MCSPPVNVVEYYTFLATQNGCSVSLESGAFCSCVPFRWACAVLRRWSLVEFEGGLTLYMVGKD